MVDPLDPSVRAWLQRELPRLVKDGYIEVAQADLIARRYGVTVTNADIAAATGQAPPTQAAALTPPGPPTPPAQVVVPGAQIPPDQLPAAAIPAAASSLPAADDPVIGTIGTPTVAPGQWVTASHPESQTAQPAGRPAGSPFSPATAGASPITPGRPSTPFIADHAVSIVLYLGAFLVVASVIIFLAYSWEDMSGGARLTVLGVLTAGFLAAAAFCLPRPAVQPAGRTFLALGAILVPANVAAVYLVYFWDSPLPPAMFWLLGGLISGGLHAALSVRLRSYGYAVLAMPSVPVAASALGWLVQPDWPWLGTSSALALAAMLAVARYAPPIPLVQTARVIGSGLLVLAFMATLDAKLAGPLSTPIVLILMTAGLAWDATRRGKTWWFGAAAALLTAPLIASVLADEYRRYWFVNEVMVSGYIAALVVRWMETRTQRLLWACAALLPAAVYPLVTWEDDRASVQLFVSLIVLAGAVAWIQKSVLPLYLGVLAVDGAYIKLLDIFGSPDSPTWALGVALWPVAVVWAAIGTIVPRRLSGPAWLGALLTMVAAALITGNEPSWNLAITASAAVATVLAAWRLRVAVLVPLAGIWLMVAGYQGSDLLQLAMPWRYVVIGLTGWLLFAVSMVRPPGFLEARPEPAVEPPATLPDGTMDSAEAVTLPADAAVTVADTTAQLPEVPGEPPAGAAPEPAPQAPFEPAPLPPLTDSTVGEWVLAARIGALAVAGLAMLLLVGELRTNDLWFEASTVSWLNVVLLLAAWAFLTGSWKLALAGALAVVPALLSGIARLHPPDPQYYAVPVAVYLLAVGTVARRRGQPMIGTVVAAAGLAALLGTSVVQSFDLDRSPVAQLIGWLNVVVLLGAWALLWRSWLLALCSALAVVPAMLFGIHALHPTDYQFYAGPVSVYLLAVGWVARRLGYWLIGTAVVGAGLAALLGTTIVQSFEGSRRDVFQAASWLGVVVFLATWAFLWRSWLLALGSALTVVPALLFAVAALRLEDAQFYAAPVGVYLLAVGTVARVRRQPLIGSIIAGVGLVVLLGTSVVQSFDRDGFRYALIALTEGLVLVGIGIAARWRVVVACGVAGTVVIALRQLFDAVSALPGWAILGGSGILLLGIAVALLVIRARLAAAGRAVAERWSQWD